MHGERRPLLADFASASRPTATASHASRLVFTLGHGLNRASAGQTSPVGLLSADAESRLKPTCRVKPLYTPHLIRVTTWQ